MKHFKQLTLIILAFSLLLCGCGGTQANGTNDNTENNSATNNSTISKTEYSLSEYLNSGETIWYLTEGNSKDSRVIQLYVIEPNGSLYFCETDLLLGELEQKEDAEIVTYVKQTYEAEIKTLIEKMISMEGTIVGDAGTSKVLTDLSSIYESYLENIEPATWKLSIITDGTGNNTEKEIFAYQQAYPLFYVWDIFAEITNLHLSYIYPYESNMGATNSFAIYDSWYGGAAITGAECGPYSKWFKYYIFGELCPDIYTDSTYYFVTRFDSHKTFYLDEVGTDNVEIDNFDSLFEEKRIDIEYETVESNYY